MDRKKRFEDLKTHPYYGQQFKKIRKADINFISQFISSNGLSDAGQWETAVNRLFIGENRPKNAGLICDLLLALK